MEGIQSYGIWHKKVTFKATLIQKAKIKILYKALFKFRNIFFQRKKPISWLVLSSKHFTTNSLLLLFQLPSL